MSFTTAGQQNRMIRVWLYAVAALVFAMIIVGGATRLTESGLSITEWKPVAGTLPPLSDGQWQAEFEKYKAIPQYKELNQGMSLDAFKTIFWWEWSHRLLGRVIGAAFLLPFLFFLWRGWVPRSLRGPLWTIFGLGAFQGAVGWWMVASGLSGRVSVSQYRLAFHLTVACLIYVALLWTARRLTPRRDGPSVGGGLALFSKVLLGLVLLQIYLGALVAGLHAGLTYNTWPSIDGAFVPSAQRLFFIAPLWRNFFENILTVQFEHRMVAYMLWLAVLGHMFATLRPSAKAARQGAWLLFAGVTAQAALGIHTLLAQAPLNLALSHQALAIVVLTLACVHAERLSPRPGSTVPVAAQTVAA